MRGVKIERAKASNAIDIHALLFQASKEGQLLGEPTNKQLMDYYLGQLLLVELPSPHHFWYLARRGKAFLGILHAVIVPSRWGNHVDTMHIDTLYVSKKSRKRGVGTKLVERIKQDAVNLGLRKVEFLVKDSEDSSLIKKYNPEKVSNFMRVQI